MVLLKELSDERNRHDYQPRKHQYEYEPDFDAPWHQRHNLLPTVAHCETCAHWMRQLAGACAITFDLGLVEVKRPGDRCACWSGYIDFDGLTAWAAKEASHDIRMCQCAHRDTVGK
jgi:hypothetical protein